MLYELIHRRIIFIVDGLHGGGDGIGIYLIGNGESLEGFVSVPKLCVDKAEEHDRVIREFFVHGHGKSFLSGRAGLTRR